MDLFASEYGWTIEYIQNNLTLFEETKLLHSILYRKGIKIHKKYHEYETPDISLFDRVNQIHEQIDTTPALEGIIF